MSEEELAIVIAQVPEGYEFVGSTKIGDSRYFRFHKGKRDILEIPARCDE